ncbi:UBX domain-containing protein 10 [Channa argus]|uniref:UBX domain-containing protein 10 n=1 Tax=Channa argus TaxID=215402 RepID=UPI002946C5D3|nr:hypothetical protein Q8A73_013606 [Channa argus]
MHLTRPKSSKGRSRPALNHPLDAGDTDGIHRPPVSSDSSAFCRPDRNFRSPSQPITWQGSQEEVPHNRQRSPAAPPLSLNKYKVLPSIGRRRTEVNPGRSLGQKMSKLSLCDDAMQKQIQSHVEPDVLPAQASCSKGGRGAEAVWSNPSDPPPTVTKEDGDRASLLLAIRAPCGRRFQQHFEPTDTLSMVRTSAEATFGAIFRDSYIETMDVPRRSFKEMDMTLAQCGILDKSVLCFSQNDDSEMEHEEA